MSLIGVFYPSFDLSDFIKKVKDAYSQQSDEVKEDEKDSSEKDKKESPENED